MRKDRFDHLVRVTLFAQDRRPVLRMLVEGGVDLPVEVVEEGDDAPKLLVLAEPPRVRPHRRLDRERMPEQRLALRAPRQRLPGSLSGWLHRLRRLPSG